jgi:hypothetical protein
MWCAVRRCFAFGPKVVALLVLVASLVVAPLTAPAAPEPCCCPQPSRCKCAEHRAANHGHEQVRRCGSPVARSAPLPAPPAALPPPVTLAVMVVEAPAPLVALPSPHASPDLERPRAPG